MALQNKTDCARQIFMAFRTVPVGTVENGGTILHSSCFSISTSILEISHCVLYESKTAPATDEFKLVKRQPFKMTLVEIMN